MYVLLTDQPQPSKQGLNRCNQSSVT